MAGLFILSDKINNPDKYHNRRQLRFVEEDGNITGLRTKDSIKYFSKYEIAAIKECIDQFY